MPINITYDIKFEIIRVKSTISKLNWYKEHAYSVKLPKLLNTSDKEIEKSINREYNEIHYSDAKKDIEKAYKLIGNEFELKIKEYFGLSSFPIIYIILTKYGVGGSYVIPDKVIININKKDVKPIIDVLKHEIIHLFAEKQVISEKLSHLEKEKLIRDIENIINH